MQSKAFLNTLPPKEMALFKTLIKFYETKQYKKGLKQAEKILETTPDHAETNAMKGLFLYLTEKHDEGFKLTKTALMKNLKSEICWHIYGIVNRNMRNYGEAVKCYMNALKIDNTNTQILKDMSLLQVQIRDIEGLYETRMNILKALPKQPTNWIGLAVINHLKEDYSEALRVLASFWKIVGEAELKPYEISEIYLYEAMILEESKDIEKMIAHLKANDKNILDRLTFNQMMAHAHITVNKKSEAIPFITELLALNPDNKDYFDLLKQAENPENELTEQEFYNKYLEKYPNSSPLKVMNLHFLKDDAFKHFFQEFLNSFITKCQPSVFSEIKAFYRDGKKCEIIEGVLIDNERKFREDEKSIPTNLLWSQMLLSQHYDYVGNHDKALEMIEKAIEHTPTLIELYLIKAKIYKHLRNYEQADHFANHARKMDLADRYLNNKGIKYSLLNGKIKEADELIKLFLRDPNDGNVHELQTMWYENELAKAYLRENNYGYGLRQLKFIEKHYNDIYEDQFDFHTYCLRKYTLRAYINMLRFEDNVNNNISFIKASTTIMNALISYKQFKEIEEKKAAETQLEKKKLTGAEKKKAKKLQEQKEKLEQEDPNKEIKQKLDLDGSKLLTELKNPYEEALKFALKIVELKISNKKLACEAYEACVKVFLLNDKVVLALRALFKLIKEGEGISAEREKFRFLEYVKENDEKIRKDSIIKEVLDEEIKGLVNPGFFERNEGNLKAKLLFLECEKMVTKLDEKKYLEKVKETLSSFKGDYTLKEAFEIFDYLKNEQGFGEIKHFVQEIFGKKYPSSPYFKVMNVEQKE